MSFDQKRGSLENLSAVPKLLTQGIPEDHSTRRSEKATRMHNSYYAPTKEFFLK